MKNKTKTVKTAFLLILTAIFFVFSGMYGCGMRSKYFAELKASYTYDNENSIFIKHPSEVIFEPNELLSYENEKTQPVEYKTLNLTLPKRNYDTGIISDYKITLGYTVYNNKLIFTEIPIQYAPCNIFVLGDKTDSFIVSMDNENAFIVTLNDSDEPSVKKMFDDGNIDELFDKNALVKLIYAQVTAVSPDGRYVLYLSNKNYIKEDSPNSLDLYSYDMQTGVEKKLMNFDRKEFLCWEKNMTESFLFREWNTTKTGKRFYSDILHYSIYESKERPFRAISDKYNSYEMIDDQYIYIFKTEETVIDGQIEKNNVIYIADLYSNEIIAANTGKYSSIWHVELSESKEYIAFFGSYINIAGIAIPEIITLNLETNDIVAQYEQSETNYFLDSFYWCPDNVLIVNFTNTTELYKDLCRFHRITHRSEKSAFNYKIDITPIDG